MAGFMRDNEIEVVDSPAVDLEVHDHMVPPIIGEPCFRILRDKERIRRLGVVRP